MASHYFLGGGLVSQLGPFKTNRNDYPKVQRRPWVGGGVAGGGQAHAGHGDWFVGMNPSVFPMQFPMPSTVLTSSPYQSVVTIHDISKPSGRANPPGTFHKAAQMVGQPVLVSAPQRPSVGTSHLHHHALQQQDEQADMELMDAEPLTQITPQQGVPQTLDLEQPFVAPPALPPQMGSTSVVIHPEEVSEEHLSVAGPPIFMDAVDHEQVEMYRHLHDDYETQPHQAAVHEAEKAVQYERFAQSRARDEAISMTDLRMTRNDVVSGLMTPPNEPNFGDGTDTKLVNEGGDELTPFKADLGTLVTEGKQERRYLRKQYKEKRNARKQASSQQRQANRNERKEGLPKYYQKHSALERQEHYRQRGSVSSASLLRQAQITAGIETKMITHPSTELIEDTPASMDAVTDLVSNRYDFAGLGKSKGDKRKVTLNDDRFKHRKEGDELHDVQTPAEILIARALAKSSKKHNRRIKTGIQVGEGPSATFAFNKGSVTGLV